MPVESTLLFGLLLVVAAAAGWWVARHTGGDAGDGSDRSVGPDYYEGLNYLLNDQPDKALDTFLKLVELDSSTLETHFALGSLFRRRGEVDRAIRIHQNIIARPNLPRAQRHQALFGLGEDYLAAGLYDRAEKLFLELAAIEGHRVAAMNKLLRIYERQRDWAQAIKVKRKLATLVSGQRDNVVSHYHCELAEDALKNRDPGLARHFLKKAESGNRSTVRTALMRAQLAAASSDRAAAEKILRRVALEQPAFAPEAIVRLWTLWADEAPDRFGEVVRAWLKKKPSLGADVAYAAIVTQAPMKPPLLDAVRDFVRSNAVLVDMLQRLGISPDETAQGDEDIRRIASALGRLANETPRYVCDNCGYAADVLYWQCPGCKAWETCAPNTRLRFNVLLDV